MRKFHTALLAATVLARPYSNGGWKMDGDKIAVDGEGNPIWLSAAGQESSIKGDAIANLNAEARTHRTAKEAAEAKLDKYKDANGKLIDPEMAVKAVETVAKIDAKQLIDAGEVDKVRDQIKAEFTTQLSEKDAALADRDNRINAMMIDGVFKGSEFIAERVAMPRDFFESAMRSNFKVEDGKVTAYDRSGNRLMSKKTPGDYADPNEALELLVEMHPQKDHILRAPDAGGTGGNSGGGNRGQSRVIKRSDFDAMEPMQQASVAAQQNKGEVQIVD